MKLLYNYMTDKEKLKNIPKKQLDNICRNIFDRLLFKYISNLLYYLTCFYKI